MKKAVLIILLLPALACQKTSPGDGPAPSNNAANLGGEPAKSHSVKLADGETALGSLFLKVPKAWTAVPISSSMRRGHWRMSADTELIVYHFGQGGAGGTEANLERWYSQFTQPDKRPTKEVAKRENVKTTGGKEAIVIDVSGQYVAAMRPGAEEKNNKPNHRMLAAIVPGLDGPYYFKLLGPDSSVGEHKKSFDEMVLSIRDGAPVKQTGAAHPAP